MNVMRLIGLGAGLALLVPATALAQAFGITGSFTGDEPDAALFPNQVVSQQCPELPDRLPYQRVENLTVSESGPYRIADASLFHGGDTVIAFYDGAFDPDNPATNRVDWADFGGTINLEAGTSYTVVLQAWCRPGLRAWYFTLSGPGTVATDQGVVQQAPWQQGQFSGGGGQTAQFPECQQAQRFESKGPFQVPEDGTYFFSDASILYSLSASDDGTNAGIDLLWRLHDAPFNPADADANRITLLDNFGLVDLEAGTDYYAVVTGRCLTVQGVYQWTLAPSGPLALNNGLNDNWFNPDTNGQGFFATYYPSAELMALGWYTFESLFGPAPGDGHVGAGEQRWMIMQGPADGDSVTMNVLRGSGGIFDDPTAPTFEPSGTATITFDNDCETGTFSYELTGIDPPLSGEFDIRRAAPDPENIDSCREQGRTLGELAEF